MLPWKRVTTTKSTKHKGEDNIWGGGTGKTNHFLTVFRGFCARLLFLARGMYASMASSPLGDFVMPTSTPKPISVHNRQVTGSSTALLTVTSLEKKTVLLDHIRTYAVWYYRRKAEPRGNRTTRVKQQLLSNTSALPSILRTQLKRTSVVISGSLLTETPFRTR